MAERRKNIALGLMSGTSGDGVSVAAITISPFRVIACKTSPYPASLRKKILDARTLLAPELSALNFELGIIFAAAAKKFCLQNSIPLSSVAVAGSHGQTVSHHPGEKPPHTLQIGEAGFIAETLGVPIVSDFRPRDMAAGGEGAPLIPFLDNYLFGKGAPVALQNIGGIGNISLTGRGIKTFGFDTGPGNCLMDTAAVIASGGKMTYDKNGKIALSGKPDKEKIAKFLKFPFFSKSPPKSLDREDFGEDFLKKYFHRIDKNSLPGVMATLNYFTAASIALAFNNHLPKQPRELVVSGGGALNPVLMKNIQILLPGVKVSASSAYGLDELAKEPACFALMAWLALNRKINHCPQATGAAGPRILGKITF